MEARSSNQKRRTHDPTPSEFQVLGADKKLVKRDIMAETNKVVLLRYIHNIQARTAQERSIAALVEKRSSVPGQIFLVFM